MGSWMNGPEPDQSQEYRGQRLGLPADGPGSLAGFGRRLAALFVDWIACLLIGRLLFPHVKYGSPAANADTLALFALEVLVLTVLTGSSFGQRLLGIRLVSLNGGRMLPLAVAARTVLLCLTVPALIWDRDGRGLQDRWTRGVLIRTR